MESDCRTSTTHSIAHLMSYLASQCQFFISTSHKVITKILSIFFQKKREKYFFQNFFHMEIFFEKKIETQINSEQWASKNMKAGSCDSMQWELDMMHRRRHVVAIRKTSKKAGKRGKKWKCANLKNLDDVIWWRKLSGNFS